jgi:type I restriction enzyme, S subunit
MEVKEGYKQTEIGIIPKDWDICDLSEAADFLDGERRPIKSSDRVKFSGVFPYYGASGIIDYVSDYIFNDDLILLGEDGENILSRNLPLAFQVKGKIWVNNHAHVLKPKATFEIGFLTDYLESLDYSLINSGTAQPKLNKQACLKIKVAKPTKTEQVAIATALSDADSLIARLEKLIEKKRAIKQGAMQELLKPKEGWLVKKLGEIADSNKKWSFTGVPFGSNLKSSDYTETGIRIIQLQNIGDGVFNNASEVFTSKSKADELISCNIYPGEIILSKTGDPVARACIIPNNHDRFLMCSDGIRLVVNEREYNTYFIYTYINSPVFRVLAENNSTGSTRKRIGLSQLRNLELLLPILDEQTAIAEILFSMDTEIITLEQKLSKYKMLKQGIMQELLTGKIRLV